MLYPDLAAIRATNRASWELNSLSPARELVTRLSIGLGILRVKQLRLVVLGQPGLIAADQVPQHLVGLQDRAMQPDGRHRVGAPAIANRNVCSLRASACRSRTC